MGFPFAGKMEVASSHHKSHLVTRAPLRAPLAIFILLGRALFSTRVAGAQLGQMGCCSL